MPRRFERLSATSGTQIPRHMQSIKMRIYSFVE
jgi:hypothetical protein